MSAENLPNRQEMKWEGTCIHDISQRRDEKHVAGSDSFSDDALRGAINIKFSLIAIGTRRQVYLKKRGFIVIKFDIQWRSQDNQLSLTSWSIAPF